LANVIESLRDALKNFGWSQQPRIFQRSVWHFLWR
jgi:hypothetical protein